jgi:aminopeptidase N
VRSQLTIVPREGTARHAAGPRRRELKLATIAIDGLPLALTAYEETPTTLTIAEPPHRASCSRPRSSSSPEKNTRLMGLYRSSGTWCTQCEPEGFRRITYYLDRPDILARSRCG